MAFPQRKKKLEDEIEWEKMRYALIKHQPISSM
jgi:hypothetical protein